MFDRLMFHGGGGILLGWMNQIGLMPKYLEE